MNSSRKLLASCAAVIALSFAARAEAQLQSFPKQELVDYTAQNPFDRLPDGRPKVPDDLLDRARELSSEDIWATLQEKGYNNQFVDGFLLAHPGKTLVGRAFTVQFMPLRADVDEVQQAKAKARGISPLMNQTAIDMLQPGDVLVVDLRPYRRGKAHDPHELLAERGRGLRLCRHGNAVHLVDLHSSVLGSRRLGLRRGGACGAGRKQHERGGEPGQDR